MILSEFKHILYFSSSLLMCLPSPYHTPLFHFFQRIPPMITDGWVLVVRILYKYYVLKIFGRSWNKIFARSVNRVRRRIVVSREANAKINDDATNYIAVDCIDSGRIEGDRVVFSTADVGRYYLFRGGIIVVAASTLDRGAVPNFQRQLCLYTYTPILLYLTSMHWQRARWLD